MIYHKGQDYVNWKFGANQDGCSLNEDRQSRWKKESLKLSATKTMKIQIYLTNRLTSHFPNSACISTHLQHTTVKYIVAKGEIIVSFAAMYSTVCNIHLLSSMEVCTFLSR